MDDTMGINYCGGGSGFWIFALLILVFGLNGFGGFGANRGAPNVATQSDVVYTSAYNQLQNENSAIRSDIQRSTYDVTGAIKDASFANLTQSRDLEAYMANGFANAQKCCCDTLRAIDGVNYNGALNTASINANTTAQTQRILDAISQNKIEALQARINTLELNNAMCGVVRYPTTMTYATNQNPLCNACGCCGTTSL